VLAQRLRERIHREGPITFAAFMDAALYDGADGFFGRGGGAGRARADFVTSPEVGPLFGTLVARALDRSWAEHGRPDPFVVVEAGAGSGRLAADVLRAAPACAPALRYVLVERSAELRARQRDHLSIEPADEALGPFASGPDPDDALEPVTGVGPIVTQLDELPAVAVDGVLLANELLDNLAVRIVERGPTGWDELRVGCVDEDAGPRFVEVLVPAPPDLAADAEAVAGGVAVPVGHRLPVPEQLPGWLESAAALLRRGDVILVDYFASATELVARGPSGWLRTYRGHARGSGALADPGAQDLTCDVPVEHLLALAGRAGFTVGQPTTQRDWLSGLGIEELVDEGAAIWRERAHLGDLAAVAGRSRVHEAAALTDPAGLGAHGVVVLRRP
jgi:SAM-dependent MidA family methyltransferase